MKMSQIMTTACANCQTNCGCPVCGMRTLSVTDGPCPGCQEHERRRWKIDRQHDDRRTADGRSKT